MNYARPVLRTDRIELRAIGPDAAEELASGGGGGFSWVPDGPFQGTRDACSSVVRAAEGGVFEPEWGVFAIVRLEDGAAVGGVGFHGPPSRGSVEIGYDLAASARGNGYVTEAVRLLTAYALAGAGVGRVVAHTEPDNKASQAVLLRSGFQRDGVADDGLPRFVLFPEGQSTTRHIGKQAERPVNRSEVPQ
ncbi:MULTISPECIES: GNAT family N-acetyltransferase [Streptacidiphilus]|uniref:GNAT family N-acetyltransferase n=1 Tax=Streptacidiphilus cavernicola TaxID=3342716 RepID=A0ABV6UP93_9ACTN|nr:GNAT family protein [Streptacidiphilus jeojiense]